MGNNRENFAASFFEEIVGAQSRERSVGIDFLSAAVKEDRKVVVVIEGFGGHLPDEFGIGALVVDADGKVTPIIVSSELRKWNLSFFEGATYGDWLIKALLLFQGTGALATGSSFSLMFGEGTGEGTFVVGFMRLIGEFGSGDVVLGEVAEGGVWVFGGKFVLPGFIIFVAGVADNVFEFVLA